MWEISIFYIYDNGTYAEGISSAWSGMTYTNGDSSVELEQYTSGSNRGGAVVIPTKVDLTNFSTLTFNISSYTSTYGHSDYSDGYIGVFSEFSNTNSYTLSASTMLGYGIFTDTKVTIDVSALNGEYYIGAYLKCTKNHRTALTITEIYLE